MTVEFHMAETPIWKTSPAWVAHRGTTMSGSRHHRTCCFDAGYAAALEEKDAERAVIEAAKAYCHEYTNPATWFGTSREKRAKLWYAVAALAESEKK